MQTRKAAKKTYKPNADAPQPKGLHTDQKTMRKFLNFPRGFLIRVELIFAFSA
jgi:hypothetical protein